MYVVGTTFACGVDAAVRHVEVVDEVGGQAAAVVLQPAHLHDAPGQLLQRRRRVHHVLHEARDQRVAAQAELAEAERGDRRRQQAQLVVVQAERAQAAQVGERIARQGAQRVVAQRERAEAREAAHLDGQLAQPVTAEVQHLQPAAQQHGLGLDEPASLCSSCTLMYADMCSVHTHAQNHTPHNTIHVISSRDKNFCHFKGKTKGTPLWGTHCLKVLKRYHLRL